MSRIIRAFALAVTCLILTSDARSQPAPKTTRAPAPRGVTITVTDSNRLSRALAMAYPGTTIRIAPGTYQGGLARRGLRGQPGRPIVLAAADPARPPVIAGGNSGLYLSDAVNVELQYLVFARCRVNGVNIDDGGSYKTPARRIVLRGVVIRDIGPAGNCDGLKLSGVDDFRVEGCTIERWGSEGSGIDMVGCHRGTIVDSTFRYKDNIGGDAVQTKGGSSEVLIAGCRFEHAGIRAINIGGNTGLPYFRPAARGYEAKDITVEDCVIIGSSTAVAFVGVDGSVVRRNTIYRPRRYPVNILQETRGPGFVPSRNGQFTDNLIAYRSNEMAAPVNIGPGTAPETFVLARNAWYCLDAPQRSRPRLPIPETQGVYGVDPGFQDAEGGDLRHRTDGALGRVGARVKGRDTEKGRP